MNCQPIDDEPLSTWAVSAKVTGNDCTVTYRNGNKLIYRNLPDTVLALLMGGMKPLEWWNRCIKDKYLYEVKGAGE